MFGLFRKKAPPSASPQAASAGHSTLFVLHDNLDQHPAQALMLKTSLKHGTRLIHELYARHLDFAETVGSLKDEHEARAVDTFRETRHQHPTHLWLPSQVPLEWDELP